MNKLLVITGHPGSGKSTLARQLSQKYQIPYLSKDAIKERIFDGLGSKDKNWSLQVSGVSHRIMDDLISNHLQIGHSIIVESNFKRDVDSVRFRDLAEKYQASCVQILCSASPDILFERWNKRIENAQRHEGHVEAISLAEIKENFTVPYNALDLPGEIIEVDTTDISKSELPILR